MSWIFARRVLMRMPSSPSFEEQIRAYNEELRRYYAQSHPASQTQAPKPEPAPEPEIAEEAAEVVSVPETDIPAEEMEAAPAETAPVEQPWEALSVDEWIEQVLHQKPGTKPPTEADAGPVWADTSWSDPEPGDPDDPWASVAAFMEREGLSGFADPPEPAPQPAEPLAEATPAADENSDTGYLQVRVFSARGAVPLVDAMVSVIGHNPAGEETLLHLNRTDQSGIAPQVSLPTPDRALSLKPGDATPFLNYVVQVSAPGYATIRNERVSVYGGVTSLQGVQMIPLPEPQSEYENVVVVRPGGAPPELN